MCHPLSVNDLLSEVPDPRRRRGRRHPFPSVLALAILALLTGAKRHEAIAQFGCDKGKALGFRRGQTPAKSTFCEIFRALDVAAFEAVLARWVRSRLPEGEERLLCPACKIAHGSKDYGWPGQHLVAAYAPHCQAVLAQIRVDAKSNEHKAASELLGILPLRGCIVTGDAMFGQRDLCETIVDKGREYVLFAKNNQPGLVIGVDAGLAFQEQARQTAAAFSPGRGIATACGGDAGRQYEERARPDREADHAANEHPDQAPGLEGLRQGFALRRERTEKEVTTVAVVQGITSLGSERADA